jgi:hypothetical protein
MMPTETTNPIITRTKAAANHCAKISNESVLNTLLLMKFQYLFTIDNRINGQSDEQIKHSVIKIPMNDVY